MGVGGWGRREEETNISKYVNNCLSTNPTTLISSSLVSDFDKEYKSDKNCVCVCGGGGGGEGEGRGALKPKQYA